MERIGLSAEPHGRASAGWIENIPNARGNVPHITRLHCDVRHNSADAAIAMEASLRQALSEIAARRGVRIDVDPYATFGPIVFDYEVGRVAAAQGGGPSAFDPRHDRRRRA